MATIFSLKFWRKKREKKEDPTKENKSKQLKEKYLGKSFLLLLERELLADEEGYLLDEWISTKVDYPFYMRGPYVPAYLPVKVSAVNTKFIHCELDQEREFEFEIRAIGTDKVTIQHKLLGECTTDKTQLCKGKQKGDSLKIRFYTSKSNWVYNRSIEEDKKEKSDFSDMKM
ncbi:hypothetical protein FACS1894176_06430 [Bacteroidia bacterium]|nr:hypothetical protein FACS189428_2150 [Clostridia bacterium]GHV26199.1 hypothetical protein FACS1894176_06430 [Bacteroidia bacterium]